MFGKEQQKVIGPKKEDSGNMIEPKNLQQHKDGKVVNDETFDYDISELDCEEYNQADVKASNL